MNKLFLALCLTFATSIFAFAQTDYKKGEFYVGYLNNQVDTRIDSGNPVGVFYDERSSHNGFEVSGVYNVHRYVGIKGDFSASYRNADKNYNGVNFEAKSSIYNYLGGVQIKDNSTETKFKPFAHALIGVGTSKVKIENSVCVTGTGTCTINVNPNSESGFAGAFGGGIDVKLGNKVSLRAIQIDYNPMRLNGNTSHNYRIGVGLVF